MASFQLRCAHHTTREDAATRTRARLFREVSQRKYLGKDCIEWVGDFDANAVGSVFDAKIAVDEENVVVDVSRIPWLLESKTKKVIQQILLSEFPPAHPDEERPREG
jgi:uncharacterized protein (DUF2235 family)